MNDHQLELPETHDGRRPGGMKTAISGAANRIQTPHDLGSSIVAVVELKVRSAGHEETEDGVVYVEKMKVSDLFEIDHAAGRRLLSAVRQAHRSADGSDPIPGLGVDETIVEGLKVTTDGSGIVLTSEEISELRDDPTSALDPTSAPLALDSAVLIFRDGSRGLWPDDWEGTGQSRAPIGGTMRRPGSTKVGDVDQVVEILDSETGESVAVWTDEDENDRLLVLESDAEAEEAIEAAREDRKVGDELDAARRHESADAEVVLGDHDGSGPDDELVLDDDADPFDQIVGSETEPDAAEPHQIDEIDAGDAPGGGDAQTATDDDSGENGPTVRFLPTTADLEFVDRSVAEVTADLAGIFDIDRVRRIMSGEQVGRGRGLKTRKGVIESCEKRIGDLFSALSTVDGPDIEDVADDFGPTDADEEMSNDA